MDVKADFLSDFPKTTILPDGKSVRLTGRYGPFTGRGIITILGSIVSAFLLTSGLPQKYMDAYPGLILAAIAGAFVGCYKLDRFVTDGRINIIYAPDAVWIGDAKFARMLPIEYRLDSHHKTLKANHGKRYDQMSEVVMQYGERRIPVAEFDSEHFELARCLVLRLSMLEHNLAGFIAATGGAAGRRDGFGTAPEIN